MDVSPIPPQTRSDKPYSRLELDDVDLEGDNTPFLRAEKGDKKYIAEDQTCRCRSPALRKLIVCIDGTSNKFEREKNTNVIRLYGRIKKSDTQLTYYNSGIGTYARPSYRSLKYLKQVVANKIDLAIAWNLEKVIMGAYRWLSENYKDGDRIYLFGFSRGAYQVRVLAGMIETVGLLHAGNEEQIPFAYELYADSNSSGSKDSRQGKDKTARHHFIRDFFSCLTQKSRNQWEEISDTGPTSQEDSFAEAFKKIFSRRDVSVHFLGAWDTVSSVGILRGKPLSLTDTCDHVCFFRHALALDERRVKFLPEYVNPPTAKESSTVQCKEVWFAGSHSQIGGAKGRYAQLEVAEVPLLWMENEAYQAGLEMLPSDIKQEAWKELPEESLRGVWWLLELIPFMGLSYETAGSRTAILPNIGKGRTVQKNQRIHASVAFKPRDGYHPKAVLMDSSLDWTDLIGTAQIGNVQLPKGWQGSLEMGLFDHAFAKNALSRLQSGTDQEILIGDLNRLIILAWPVDGRQAILDVNRSLITILGLVSNATSRPAVSECSMRLLFLLSKQFDDSPQSVTNDEELVPTFTSERVNDILEKLLQPRPTQAQVQLAALRVVLLLLYQGETRAALLKVAPEGHLVQLLEHWLSTTDILAANVLRLSARAVVALSKTPRQANLLLKAGVVSHLLDLLNLSTVVIDVAKAATEAISCIGDVDIEVATELQSLLHLTSDDHPAKPTGLGILGSSFMRHFERLGRNDAIDKSIAAFEETLQLTSVYHADTPSHLSNLGRSLLLRFKYRGDIADVEKSIRALEDAVRLTPHGHADTPARLSNLGRSFLRRFEHFGDVADIDHSIAIVEEAVLLTPDGHAEKSARLSNLGRSFLRRFEHFGDLADVAKSVAVAEEAVRLTPDGHSEKPARLGTLGNSLSRRFEYLGDIADIDMAVSVHENAVRLTPDDRAEKPVRLNSLGNSLLRRFERFGNVADIDHAVAVVEEAVQLTPDDHPEKPARLSTLGNSLLRRFERLGNVADIDMSFAAHEHAMGLTPDGHADKPIRLSNLGNSLLRRFERFQNVADIDMAVAAHEHAVGLTPDGHAEKPARLNNLGNSLLRRFESFGRVADIDNAVQVVEMSVQLTPDGHAEKPTRLSNLGHSFLRRFERLGSVADINHAVAVVEEAVRLTPDGHSEKPSHLSNLGRSFLSRFERFGELADIDKSVAVVEEAVRLTPDDHAEKPARLSDLGNSFLSRFQRLGSVSDLSAAALHFCYAARSSIGLPLVRFRAAAQWARCSAMQDAPTLDAYQCAIDLLPRVAWLGLPIADRRKELAGVDEVIRDAVVAAIEYGKYQTALEWLDQNSSVIWGQLLNLHTPIDELRAIEPILADRLENVSGRLEHESRPDSLDHQLSLEEIARNQRALALEWDRLVERARAIPGFEDFLLPRTLSRLRHAMRSGPVVAVSVHKRRCDVLVLKADSDDMIHIPLHDFSYDQAQDMQNSLEALSRLHMEASDEALNTILSKLWLNVVKPVLDGLVLTISRNEDPPRIWWYPTGPLTSLPLHAAGIYDKEEPGFKISDFVVSSYTPSLTALLDPSRQLRATEASELQLLAVIQPHSPGQVPMPNAMQELAHVLRHAGSLSVRTLEGDQATVERVAQGMKECNWIHLACHFTLLPDDPMKSALLLQDGRLELSEMIKTPLPRAEFAFLSASEIVTRETRLSGGVVRVGEEMLLAGYRGVIATTWGIKDSDVPLVVDEVYARLFEDSRPDHTRAAYALHHAVKRLRESEGVAFSSWVSFIHVGM